MDAPWNQLDFENFQRLFPSTSSSGDCMTSTASSVSGYYSPRSSVGTSNGDVDTWSASVEFNPVDWNPMQDVFNQNDPSLSHMLPAAVLQSSSTPHGGQAHGPKHNCHSLTSTILGTFDPDWQIHDPSAHDSGYATSNGQTPPLDMVLNNNKSAVANVAQMLNCPSCAGDPYVAMAYAMILSKVIKSYESVASRDVLSASSSKQKRPSSGKSKAPSKKVVSAVQIGSFQPNEEDQCNLRRMLLLHELEKAGEVIDALASMPSELPGNVEERACEVYTTLGSWLKSDLSKIQRRLSRV